MHDPISIIMCIVGVIGCVVGVSTFVSAQITKAKEDGVLMAKVDQLVASLEELKNDTKARNIQTDSELDRNTRAIVDITARVRNLEKEVFHEVRGD